MVTRPRIAIIGSGRLGSALAGELFRAGYPITEVVSRENAVSVRKARALARLVDARADTVKTASFDVEIVWLCVPDREIGRIDRKLAARFKEKQWKGKAVFHSSGALTSDELKAVRSSGAAVASVHPLMTFVVRSIPPLRGAPFAIEGDASAVRLAQRIVRALGGYAFSVRKQDKVAYHAWATFCSPLLIATLVTAERVGRIAGFSPASARRKMLPIVKQTLANYAVLGPAGAFSGPIVRGDAEIVSKHLKVLKKIPEARAVYLTLAQSAMGHLPIRNRAKLGKALNR